MQTAGLWMLLALALLLIGTGLPAWTALIAVSLAFALGGVATGIFPSTWLAAMPGRLLGLLDNDLLQALPLYVLMGASLNHLPLAKTLFRVGNRLFARTGAGPALTGFGLGALLAPMNGSVGASMSMLSRALYPQLEASGMGAERSAALVCVTSTLGVAIPPSLVLILLGDAMMRAHTEALNVTRASVRIINTQDVLIGAAMPAALLLFSGIILTLVLNRASTIPGSPSSPVSALTAIEWITAFATTFFIVALLVAVTSGYLYAVEAAAAGGVALFLYGVATRTLTRTVLRAILRDTMAIAGALFALLVGATVFTLTVRAFGTDRWLATTLTALGGQDDGAPVLMVALLVLALCALVLDAFEMIFVVIPVLMPPLLIVVPNVTWVAVLTLLILQVSFLTPPLGYAVMMVRNLVQRPLRTSRLALALLPFLLAQVGVLLLVFEVPALVWQRDPIELDSSPAGSPSLEQQGRDLLQQQLDQQQPADTPGAGEPK